MPIRIDDVSSPEKIEEHEFDEKVVESQISGSDWTYESQVERDDADVEHYSKNPDEYLKDGAAKPEEGDQKMMYSAEEIAQDLAKSSELSGMHTDQPATFYKDQPEHEEGMDEEETIEKIAEKNDEYREDEEGVSDAVKSDMRARAMKSQIETELESNPNIVSREVDGETFYQHKDNL